MRAHMDLALRINHLFSCLLLLCMIDRSNYTETFAFSLISEYNKILVLNFGT